jgi:hypothetical protein
MELIRVDLTSLFVLVSGAGPVAMASSFSAVK